MEKLHPRFIGGEGTRDDTTVLAGHGLWIVKRGVPAYYPIDVDKTLVVKLDGSIAWEYPVKELPTTGNVANTLTRTSGGGVSWLGNAVVLIEPGGSVPGNTPAGAIIVEKDE